MAVKKAFLGLIALLESNKDKKVSAILPKVIELASAKGAGGGENSFIKNDKDVVTHIYCYYHKKWEAVNPDGKGDKTHCEYGKKANTPTGLNTMCKIGVSMWTKQNRVAKSASVALLDGVAKGDIKPSAIKKTQEDNEKARSVIVPREDKLGTEKKPA